MTDSETKTKKKKRPNGYYARGSDLNYYRLRVRKVKQLDALLFPEGQLKFFPPIDKSAGMEIMDLFILRPLKSLEEIPVHILEAHIAAIFGAGYGRDVIRYKATEDFYMGFGRPVPMAEIPWDISLATARHVRKGDTILARIDGKNIYDEELEKMVQIQLLSNGLFGSDDEDWKIFQLTVEEFGEILKSLSREERVCDGTGFNVSEWYQRRYTKINPR